MKKNKIFYLILFSLSGFLIFNFTFAQDKKLPVLQAPDLKVSIPNSQTLENVQCTGETCYIPWLGQYIAGIQRYAIGIVGIIAVIVLMIGGIIWLTAAGNQGQIEQAKKMIGGSLIGLFLVFGSYLILYLINPNLTEFPSLRISMIKNVPFSLTEEEYKTDTPQWPAGTPISTSPISNQDIDFYDTEISLHSNFLLSTHNVFKIKSANAQTASQGLQPPDFVPSVQQKDLAFKHDDYSTQATVECMCGGPNLGENYNTGNNKCNQKYNNYSTIGSSGCGLAALNMVLAAYSWSGVGTSRDDMLEMAAFMGQDIKYRKCGGGTSKEGLIAYAQSKNMQAEIIKDRTKALDLIEKGYPIMVSVDHTKLTKEDRSRCTGFYHWIVVTGIVNGEFTVINPYDDQTRSACSSKHPIPELKGVQTFLFIHP